MADVIIIKDGITPAMQEMARSFPKEINQGMISLGQWLRKKIGTESKAGDPAGEAFQPLNVLTLMLRNSTANGQISAAKRKNRTKAVQSLINRTDVRQLEGGFGGKLTGGGRPYGLISFKAYKVGDEYQVSVGFMDEFFPGSVRAAERFQAAQPEKEMRAPSRILLRLRLGKDFKQPIRWPAKPERNIFQPYVNDLVTQQEKIRVLATAITRIRQNAINKSQSVMA